MNTVRKTELQIDDVVFTVDNGFYAQGNFRNRFVVVSVSETVAILNNGVVLRRSILSGNAVLTVDTAVVDRYYYESRREREEWVREWDEQCE